MHRIAALCDIGYFAPPRRAGVYRPVDTTDVFGYIADEVTGFLNFKELFTFNGTGETPAWEKEKTELLKKIMEK